MVLWFLLFLFLSCTRCVRWMLTRMRSSRLRIKTFLYVLVRDLEFSIDPAVEIEKKVKCVLSFSPSVRASRLTAFLAAS